MKKSLIALAVAGAFAAPAAMAAVTIGGEIDAALQSFNNGSKSGLQVANTHTRWWMDNADDIGGGMSVVAHFEIDQAVSGTSPINNRNSFIGLKGDFGMVKMGTEEGIYEQLGYQVDAYHGAAGPAGNIVNGLGQSGITGSVCGGDNLGCRRESGTISYVSPDINGLNFKVDYSVKGPQTNAAPNDNNATTLQGGGYWSGNAGGTGVRAGLGMIQVKNSGAFSGIPGFNEKGTGTRLTLGATFGDFMIDGLFETNKWEGGGVEAKYKHLWLQGVYNLPTGKVIVDIMKLGKTQINGTDLNDTGGKHFGLGYYHNLSKSSAVYVIYSKLDNEDNAQFNLADGPTAAPGKDPSSISFGIYTVF
jgi:predicted porin